MTKILMIDDDQALCESLSCYMGQFGIELLFANTPDNGLKLLSQCSPKLLLLDVMMPETDGFTLCKQIRSTHTLPIIMLTARGQLNDKVHGLELGADDYMAKPFEPRELVARVQSFLRRVDTPYTIENQHRSSDKLVFDGMTLYPEQHKLEVDGKAIKVTGMEFSLLVVLANNIGKVFNRDQIISQLKGIEVELYSRSVDILLSRLRQKLNDDPKQPRFIKTLRNVGYTFVGKPL